MKESIRVIEARLEAQMSFQDEIVADLRVEIAQAESKRARLFGELLKAKLSHEVESQKTKKR
jgi:uncharacterized coiled-coil protein SlyX